MSSDVRFTVHHNVAPTNYTPIGNPKYSLVHGVVEKELKFLDGEPYSQWIGLEFESPKMIAGARNSLDNRSRYTRAQGFIYKCTQRGLTLYVRKERVSL